MIIGNFKELTKEEYEKLSKGDKKKYLVNKINLMNVTSLKDKKEEKK